MQQPLRYDHYRVLGVPRDAGAKEIKRAYRDRVKSCHPDRNASPQAATLFHAVHQAYQILSDTEQRARYDGLLQHYHSSRTASPKAARRPVRRFEPDAPEVDRPMNRFAFVGLHVTGLCFGLALVVGILVGVVFYEWPSYTLLFSIPGIVVLPDSLAGIRWK